MNNAFYQEVDESPAIKAKLEERCADLIKLIKVYEGVTNSKEWQTLQEVVFNKSILSIEKQIFNVSTSPSIDVNKLYSLQGEWAALKKYNNLGKYVETLKLELLAIKKKLNE